MSMPNVAKIEGSPVWSQQFESDGTHLTESAGKVFVENLIANAQTFFTEVLIDLEKETTGGASLADEKKDSSWITKRIAVVEKEIGQLNKDLTEKNRDILERRLQDSLVTARMREELDFISNTKKEDKIIITGLTSKTAMPESGEEKRTWLNTLVGEILDKIEPEASKHVTFTSLGSRNSRIIPVVEVKLDSSELAKKIRKGFGEKKKSGQDFGRVFVANSVTLATRVRVDILKAISKRNTNDKETFSVSAFVSRPVLHIRSKESGKSMGTFNFSDALARYGSNLTAAELGEAYRRAGSAFKGQLQQNFVVLNEQGAGGTHRGLPANSSTGENPGTPRKRFREVGGLSAQAQKNGKNPKLA